jgi:hypothetical protein
VPNEKVKDLDMQPLHAEHRGKRVLPEIHGIVGGDDAFAQETAQAADFGRPCRGECAGGRLRGQQPRLLSLRGPACQLLRLLLTCDVPAVDLSRTSQDGTDDGERSKTRYLRNPDDVAGIARGLLQGAAEPAGSGGALARVRTAMITRTCCTTGGRGTG